MKRSPGFGIMLATVGTLILTPDSMFMRLSEMSGAQMFAWRGLLMGSALLLGWVLSSRHRARDVMALGTGAGLTIVLCQFVNATLFSLGIAAAPVSIVLFGLATVPVFATVFAWLILGERASRGTWITIIVVIIGIGIAVLAANPGRSALIGRRCWGRWRGLGWPRFWR